MQTKSWYKSKTVWFNLLTVIVVVATFFGYTPNDELGGQVSMLLIAFSPLINIILRLFTKKAIE